MQWQTDRHVEFVHQATLKRDGFLGIRLSQLERRCFGSPLRNGPQANFVSLSTQRRI